MKLICELYRKLSTYNTSVLHGKCYEKLLSSPSNKTTFVKTFNNFNHKIESASGSEQEDKVF